MSAPKIENIPINDKSLQKEWIRFEKNRFKNFAAKDYKNNLCILLILWVSRQM